jgi:hypothetical protein
MLSNREVEERIEQVFRARTSADLDAVLAGLPRAPHIAAEMVRSHGVLSPPAPATQRPWWHGIVIWSAGAEVFWIILWLIFGGSVGYLALAMVSTLTAFGIRLIVRYRRHITGKPRRRWRRV